MHPSRPCLRLLCPRLALLLSLLLLAGLAGCGPASSDNAPNLGPRASVDGSSLSKQGPSPRTDTGIPAASPVPLTSVNGTGSAPSPYPVGSPDTRAVPDWMAKELASPDVGARLRALETWAQSAPPGAVGPLILALKDKDERVQARAMELIEQQAEREAEAEELAGE